MTKLEELATSAAGFDECKKDLEMSKRTENDLKILEQSNLNL